MKPSPKVTFRPVARLLSVAISLRIFTDTAFQLFFPFLPVLAAGVGISVAMMGRLLALRTLMGLFAPLLGELADKRGYRAVMHSGLLLLSAGLLLFAFSQNIGLAILSLILMGLGFNAFVPNLFAYSSAQIPFHMRSRGLGMLELSWAFAGIVGLFLVGQGIVLFGWRATLGALGGLIFVVSFVMRTLPATDRDNSARAPRTWQGFGHWRRSYFAWGSHARSAWAVHITGFCAAYAGTHIFGTYGEWLFADFDFDAGQLGTMALFLGIADLVSNGLISLFGDRVGTLRSLRLAAPMAALLALGHLWLGTNLAWLIAGLLLLRFLVENVYVNGLIIASGQLPQQRGKMMTINATFGTLGIALANVTGPEFFVRFGPAGLALPTCAGFLLASLLFFWAVDENAPIQGARHE